MCRVGIGVGIDVRHQSLAGLITKKEHFAQHGRAWSGSSFDLLAIQHQQACSQALGVHIGSKQALGLGIQPRRQQLPSTAQRLRGGRLAQAQTHAAQLRCQRTVAGFDPGQHRLIQHGARFVGGLQRWSSCQQGRGQHGLLCLPTRWP